MLRGYDFLVNICEVKLQRIKNDIEQIKEKLNLEIEKKDTLNITVDILNLSQELDILIVTYYCILERRQELASKLQ